MDKWTVHIEVRLNARASARFETIRNHVHSYVTSVDRLAIPSTLDGWDDIPELASSVDRISVCESQCTAPSLTIEEMSLQIHVYKPSDSDAFEEFSNSAGNRNEDDDTMAASVCELPNKNYEGLWDSLIYADDVKMKLLDYIHATLIFSDANVDLNLVSWNRVVLLHGPPGTGKTSLCRALAQKLSIRLSHRYSHTRLLEINSHSLFSKWFSESGKLVQRLFSSITELVEEEDGFVVVLIDEVESLTAARAGAMAGTEPSDGLRVVNALLTQLDKLKQRKNVLVMATSNLVKAIDTAFLDRADIVQYVDLPSREAIYEILRSALCEIILKGIVAYVTVPALKQVQLYELMNKSAEKSDSIDPQDRSKNVSLRLLALATQCRTQGMSGRALRRLPVLALARYIGIGNFFRPQISGVLPKESKGTPVEVWLDGMEKAVGEHVRESERLN
ncbi:P-loop containing nucleoside triphosphate hydrolase protein [Gymnopilus junonius]|uniref:P-loop containing nucleoside triphosphate hydrolase protein n=1 Tax=Gymnopilus junonius TaxID=109634 RepID=A0A9P5NLI8_GYMJU|nr:P-loop containing nucleoside triphosphate hydrolase protein [Gymnopilus junonius]